jgi:hypothetical protein
MLRSPDVARKRVAAPMYVAIAEGCVALMEVHPLVGGPDPVDGEAAQCGIARVRRDIDLRGGSIDLTALRPRPALDPGSRDRRGVGNAPCSKRTDRAKIALHILDV